MKKQFRILVVSAVMVSIMLSLVGTALVSQAASADKNQNPRKQAPKPIPATNIKVVKKVLLSPILGGAKGRPFPPPGQDKDKNGNGGEEAATGILGAKVMGNKYAVVIGICDYPDGEKNYDICLSDGDSYNMYKALIGLYGYDPANIYWFRDMSGTTTDGVRYGLPTYGNIFDAVMEIKGKTTGKDEVVFFFSGHGASGEAKDKDEELMDEGIVVHDSDRGINDGNSQLDFIWDGELRSWFDGFGTTRVIFVFDTCLAGGMNDVASDGRIVAMSTGETQSAYVYSTGEFGEGVFSHYFVNEGMLQGLADTTGTEGVVTIEEAFDYTKENIPPYLKRRQKPVINDSFENDLLLGY